MVHYCVTNMPAIVPNTSTYALTNSTLSYGLELANRGFPQALVRNKALAKGLILSTAKSPTKASPTHSTCP